jgi:hypothetical protein
VRLMRALMAACLSLLPDQSCRERTLGGPGCARAPASWVVACAWALEGIKHQPQG